MLSSDMYQANILEHYKDPHNYGALPGHNVSIRDVNPLCGDVIEVQMLVEGGTIKKANFLGKGCAISQASASMLTDELRGKTVEDALETSKQDVLEMLGIDVSPARQKCAFLALKVAKMCIYISQGKKAENEEEQGL